jgi:triphosphatase
VNLVPTEIELKLSLDPTAMNAVVRHPAVKAARHGRTRTVRVASRYYDTDDFQLAEANVALRVRRIGAKWVQTIKGPPDEDAGAGLHARAEFEWPLSRPALDPARMSETPWSKLFAKATKRRRLDPRFTTDFERRSIPLRFADGTLAELCLDRGEIQTLGDGRRRSVPIAELELELETGAATNLFRLALDLAADLPLAVMTTSKAERGVALVRGERDRVGTPVHARSVTLAENATTADALSMLVRECLDQIAANAPGLLVNRDPEWIHQMRIGTRRLRSCLRLIAPLAPSVELERLITDVKWLADVLGAARDLDVFVDETLPPLAAGFARDPSTAPGLKHVRARVQARRRLARKAVFDAVGSPRFQRMLLAGGLFCATPRFGAAHPAGSADRGDGPDDRADAFARALLARRHRRLEQRAVSLTRGSPDERHAVRIAAKRLRYIAEFFAPLFPRKRSRAYLKALTALQDVLGRLNDAVTALRVANESRGTSATAATGAVRGWVAAQAAAIEPELAPAWRRFARAKPFWLGS